MIRRGHTPQVREGVIDIGPYLGRGEKGNCRVEDGDPVNIVLSARSCAFLIKTLDAEPEHLSIRFVTGDSMFPTPAKGDAVLIDAVESVIRVQGIYGISFGENDPPQICRLQRLPNDLVKVTFDNRAYESFHFNFGGKDVRVLGRVIWALKSF